ncbi:MAG TPA: PAS domain S-box protein [Pirellulaceae bacterium]|jgi:PAS domain S-box-containing protein|nr:PAS domain S-box protein [Pirellulaceae bacterium]
MDSYRELNDLLIDRVEEYAIFLLDAEGHVLTWNRGAERIKGYRADEVVGKHLSIFYPPDARLSPEQVLATAAEAGHFEEESWRVRKDGSRFWGNVSLTALRSDDGELKGFAKITRDLTQRHQAEVELSAAKLKFDLLMTGVQEYAIFMMDPEGRVTDWNAAAERLLGYAQEEIIGQHFAIFWMPEEGGPGGVAEQELRQAVATGRASDDRWHVRKDGTHFWANGITSALRDEAGNLKGFAKVLRDKTERKRFEEELRAKADALENADRRKDEFLAMLAHELRNPLSPVATAVALLDTSEKLGEEEREIVGIVHRQVTKLTRLVNDLMDVSRITRGKVQLDRERIDLRDVVAHAIQSIRPAADEREVVLSVAPGEERLEVSGDATRLEQVFENLLNNAVKYTPAGGRVIVTVERKDGTAAVRVADTGVGIAPELLPYVFELFTQDSRTLDRAEGGLGIGLTIVKNIVEMHEGTVDVSTGGPGKGSEFLVRLPLAGTLSTARFETPSNLPVRSRSIRALVVDDNTDSAKLIAMLLRSQGHEVATAYCGRDAVATALSFRPQLILLDIGLPGLDGYQVAQRLREQTDTRDVVLVAVTGYGQPEDKVKARDAGFDYHLVKPIGLDDLRQIIESISHA